MIQHAAFWSLSSDILWQITVITYSCVLPAIPAQVVSSTLLGAALGSLTGGAFADALGRRKAFMLCAVPMLIGPILSATANNLNTMVAGRLLAGVSIGLSSALVPLYISEVSSTPLPVASHATLASRQLPTRDSSGYMRQYYDINLQGLR